MTHTLHPIISRGVLFDADTVATLDLERHCSLGFTELGNIENDRIGWQCHIFDHLRNGYTLDCRIDDY